MCYIPPMLHRAKAATFLVLGGLALSLLFACAKLAGAVEVAGD